LDDPFRLTGKVVDGKYRIEGILGEGGHGIVYSATHVILEAPVAMKVLKPFHAGADAKKAQELFLREARILFALGHPVIVCLYDVGNLETPIGSTPYVVLERLEGKTLNEELVVRGAERRHMSIDELRKIFEPVLDALAFAHGAGVLHRDLKPSNIMLLDTGGAKILDFGVARWADPSLQSEKTGPRTGFTVAYAAPEQWLTGGSESAAVDVFSIGLVLIEALTLERVPAPGLASGSKLDLVTTRPELPRSLIAVVDRATKTAPVDRYASAKELRDAWRATFERASTPVSAPSHHPDTFAETEAIAPPTPVRTTTPARERQSMVPIAAIGAVVILGGLALRYTVGKAGPPAPKLIGFVRTNVFKDSDVYSDETLPKPDDFALLACYTEGAKHDPALAGEIAILAGVRATGEVHKALSVETPGMNKDILVDDGVHHCVSKVVASWIYPKHNKEDVVGLLYVFAFHPKQKPDALAPGPDPEGLAGIYEQHFISKSTGPFDPEKQNVRRFGHRVMIDYPDGTMACWYSTDEIGRAHV